jgi:hypothetical protein
MQTSLFTASRATIFSSVALLVACGGGAGGGGDVVASSVVFTSANQAVVSQEGVSSAYLPLGGAETITGAQVVDESLIFDAMRKQIDALPDYIRTLSANPIISGATQSEVVNCAKGGTLTIAGSIANINTGASGGDTVQLTANACKEGNYTLSGGLNMRINSVTGSFGGASYSAGLTITFVSFGVSAPQFSSSMNGDLTMAITASSLRSSTATLSSSALAINANYAGVASSRSLTNYSATSVKSPSGLLLTDSTNTISGTLSSTALQSQSITFSTPTPMVTRGLDDYPSSGVIVLTGGNNTRIRITAIDKTQYRQELDANGDGVYEGSATNPWSTLF